MRAHLVLIPALVLGAAACTTPRGFDRGALRQNLATQMVVTEAEIQLVLELEPQLPDPYTVGVYFAPPSGAHGDVWKGESGDRERVLDRVRALERGGSVAKTVPISGIAAERSNLKSIRLAAARHGADAVLVVSGAADLDRYNNELGLLYALLVTPLFVPGTVVDTLFVSHAALWDVRNGFLYASVEADGTSRQTRPAAIIDERDALLEAKARSLETLGEGLEAHLWNLQVEAEKR